ncbi:flagellar basal body-associated FliL family protein [Thalassovita sp.]|uniref:flagellar basal body-associated FliL family protein n=1 Tax=Thalassovita sp. TaxID=1979401 RepID=UPI0029DE6CF2|nr:flagellar basal body-associated FliL family protein [Thalassovita sp.]
MKKLIPLVLPVIGLAAGIGAGIYLPGHTQPPLSSEQATDTDHAQPAPRETAAAHDPATLEYVKLNNQFIVPVITRDAVSAIIVLSLSLEAREGSRENIYAKEPKLRDSFLQVLFDHANMGGFDGAFTDATRMETLRKALLAVARKAAGDMVTDILITDLGRQDV